MEQGYVDEVDLIELGGQCYGYDFHAVRELANQPASLCPENTGVVISWAGATDISWTARSSRVAGRSTGRRVAKTIPPIMEMPPAKATVAGAPMAWAKLPATSALSGTMPMNTVE